MVSEFIEKKEIDRAKITINADDFGHSEARTNGIVQAFNLGLIDRTTLMVNMPDCERAVELAKENGFLEKIGLHLNLTEGKPITEKICQCKNLTKDEMFSKNILSYVRKHKLTTKERIAIFEEIRAQVARYKGLGLTLMHIDSHHHVHTEWQILSILIPIVNNFKSMRIGLNLYHKQSLASWTKIIYKYIINRRIKCNFTTTQYLGNMHVLNSLWDGNSTIEIETHPEIINDITCDVISPKCIVNIDDYSYLFHT